MPHRPNEPDPDPLPRARRLLPIFLRPRAILRFLRDPAASRSSKFFFVLAMLYLLLPLDLIPDVAPVVGWFDDLGILGTVLAWALSRAAAHARARGEDGISSREAASLAAL